MADAERDPIPSEEEFDAWNDELEEEAVKEAAKNMMVKHLIKGDSFFAMTPSGDVYRLPLSISIDQFSELETVDDADSIEGLKKIIGSFGSEYASKLEAEPIVTVTDLMRKYVTAVVRVQGATLGE